jgi:hypothetical protein
VSQPRLEQQMAYEISTFKLAESSNSVWELDNLWKCAVVLYRNINVLEELVTSFFRADSKGGDDMFLWNLNIGIEDYTVSHTSIPIHKRSQQWKLESCAASNLFNVSLCKWSATAEAMDVPASTGALIVRTSFHALNFPLFIIVAMFNSEKEVPFIVSFTVVWKVFY